MHTKVNRFKRTAIGAAVVLGSVGLGGAGFAVLSGGGASAATSTSSPASTPTATTKDQKLQRFLRRHTVSATFTIKTKSGYETLDLVRGTVSSISPTSITVNSPNGTTVTASIDSSTKFHNTSDAVLGDGDKVGVLAYDGVARSVNAPKSASTSSSSS
jgi:Domain of unknown function (DUF5666)